MRFDRDMQIFLVLLFSVVLVNVLPLPPIVRLPIFILVVIAQAVFIYRGLTRKR